MPIPRTSTVWKPANIYDNAVIGEHVSIGMFSEIGNNVSIGDGTRIGAHCFIPEGVTIGSHCFIGPHVCFTNDRFPPQPKEKWERTIIEDGVSIGAGTTVLCGLTIGANSMIGCGAVVTCNVPHAEVWVGVPAKKLRDVGVITIEPAGRLANQLICWASARCLLKRLRLHGKILCLKYPIPKSTISLPDTVLDEHIEINHLPILERDQIGNNTSNCIWSYQDLYLHNDNSRKAIESELRTIKIDREFEQVITHRIGNDKSIGVHIRYGDFSKIDVRDEQHQLPTFVRASEKYYLKTVRRLVQETGIKSIFLASNGKDDELTFLTSQFNVKRSQAVNTHSAITDLFCLSKCSVIVGSDSTFSYVASALAEVPITYPRHHLEILATVMNMIHDTPAFNQTIASSALNAQPIKTLTDKQMRWLFLLAKSIPHDAAILEIGCYHGLSALCMAMACPTSNKHILSVDINSENIKKAQQTLIVAGLQRYVSFKCCDSTRLDTTIPREERFDLVFVDGDHRYEFVAQDFEHAFSRTKAGGIIALHDVCNTFPDVKRFWDTIASKRLTNIRTCDSLAYGTKL